MRTDGFGPAERKENHQWVGTGAAQTKEKISGGGSLQPRQGFLPEQKGTKCLSYSGHIRLSYGTDVSYFLHRNRFNVKGRKRQKKMA